MKAPRLPDVTARVVAWHNRHPLARRIDPTQVHSIGAVELPFASQRPWGALQAAGNQATPAAADMAPTPTPHAPTLAEALAQRTARHPPAPAADAGGLDGLDVQSMLPDTDAGADLLAPTPAAGPPGAPQPADTIDLALDAADSPPPDDDDGEAALVIPLLDGDGDGDGDHRAAQAADGDADTPPRLANAADGAPAVGAAPEAGAAALLGATAHTPAESDDPAAALPPDTALPGGTAAAAEVPALAEVYPPPHGSVPASALARAVERRAAARGVGAAPAEGRQGLADAAPPGRWRRLLAVLRLAITGRQAGMPPLRASFSQEFAWPLRPGQVARWAQRHGQPYPVAPADWPRRSVDPDRARVATLRQKGLAHDVPLHVLTAAIGVGDRRMRVLLGADGSVLGPRAYSRARVGSAAALLAMGLVGAGWTLRPLHGAGNANHAAALAALAASAPASAALAASAPAEAASNATAVAEAEAASAPDDAASSAQAGASASAPADTPSETAAASADDAASQPAASIRPQLSDEARYAARVQSAKLRGEPPPPPPPEAIEGPVYAVVSTPSRQREAAAGSLVLMKSAASRLAGPAPAHGELVESQGQWRAAWWPFASLVDAERARVLLAGKGLKAEVVEF